MKTSIVFMLLLAGVLALCCGTLSAQEERWVYSYNGPADSIDDAYSIVMGTDGNLYAAGESHGTGTSNDFIVVSLTLSGTKRWVYRYNGPGNHWDAALVIVMGTDGNLYAAGVSWGTGTNRDFTVISLDTSGTERWVYRYDGPGNYRDWASSIVMGTGGNLYAAGFSTTRPGFTGDFTVISLTPSGVERWVYRYSGPGNQDECAESIVMGTDGNLYAAGHSKGNGTYDDLTVISLDTSGTERWVYLYDGPANHRDFAYSIVMGTDGNLYAAGSSRGSGTGSDLTVISLDTSGMERWVYRYNGPGDGFDMARSIVAGIDGDIYAAGSSYGIGTSDDFTVISLDTSGTERWVYRYNGPGDTTDKARSIVAGADGNLYVAGRSEESGIGRYFTVVSLDTSGAERWIYTYSGPADSASAANSIVIGQDGNLYAAGYSVGGVTLWDFTVISLGPDVGVVEWENRALKPPTLEISASPIPAVSGVKICYTLPKSVEARLSVYDSSGRLVKNLANAQQAGSRVSIWNGRDDSGAGVPGGIYFCRLTQGDLTATTKLILLR